MIGYSYFPSGRSNSRLRCSGKGKVATGQFHGKLQTEKFATQGEPLAMEKPPHGTISDNHRKIDYIFTFSRGNAYERGNW
jgi:hypothetical protein